MERQRRHGAGIDGGLGGEREDAPPPHCPYCGAHGTVRTAEYDAPLRILRPRRWHYCTRCGWEAEAGRPTRSIAARTASAAAAAADGRGG